MQALSFSVHIPLVCFGIAFPAMVLFVEWLYLRSGDELYRTLARRWTRVMAALFAVGVITGTILSFEMGLLWPDFTATFGSVFGLGFAIEGFSFFLEAIFIGIYIYGWDRLSPRAHFLSGIPIAIAGITGSLMVIAVNAWMNDPTGFRLVHGKAVDVHPLKALFANSFIWPELVHMYIAGYIVAGFLLAGAYASGGCADGWGRYERTALAIPLTIAALASPVQLLDRRLDLARRRRPRSRSSSPRSRGSHKTTKGAPEHLLGWYTEGQVKYGIAIPKLLSLLAFHNPNAVVKGLDTVPADRRPPVNVVRVSFQTMVGDRHRCSRCSPSSTCSCAHQAQAPARVRVVLPRARARRPRLGGRADRRLGHDRGRTPAVGRLQSDAHQRGGHRRRAASPSATPRSSLVYICVGLGVVWILRRLARMPMDRPAAGAAPPAAGRATDEPSPVV